VTGKRGSLMAAAYRYYIETFGCQMNKGESDLIMGSMQSHGFIATDTVESADVAVYNTCSVRDHAERRALAIIRANNAVIRQRGGITVIAGCMAQRMGNDLIMDGTADLVIGPYGSPDAGRLLTLYLEDRNNRTFLSQKIEDLSDRFPSGHAPRASDRWHRWITISHGCCNRCSYCIVPQVRGPLVSFSSGRILEHLTMLAGCGVTEVTLLGQNVNQYGTDSGDIPFSSLLEKAAAIRGFDRINFLTSHPRDFTDDIARVIRDNENISRSIHLPLQSGSDRILGLMSRGYTLRRYMTIVEGLARHLKDYALSTDLIVGFPGETPGEYGETLRAVEEIRFDDAFMYAYSPRSGTASHDLVDRFGADEKKERLTRLIQRQREISAGRLSERIDAVERAIIERISKKSSKSVMGKTFLNHPIVIPGGAEDIGKIITVRVSGVAGSTLQGNRIA
jgi:tRNA-2-methylthio-N6-dimethylallyladenosine synthase